MSPHHDLVVIGAGSGNFVIDDSFADVDVAIVSDGAFGGTCLNAGCIPSKILARTAEVANQVRGASTFDIDATLHDVRWADARRRVFDRTDAIARDGRAGREDSEFVTVYAGHAEFMDERRLQVASADHLIDLTADQIVIAAGSRPAVPPVIAGSGIVFHTTETIMRIDAPPRRLAVLGGGYVAAELAEVFDSFGSAVTIIEQAPTLLAGQDEAISAAFTRIARSRYDVRLGREVVGANSNGGVITLRLDDDVQIETDCVLVATGRIPNSDRLGLDRAGIRVHGDGRIVVDKYQRTNVDGVWALGDISTDTPLKHVANREAEAVAHNVRRPDELMSAEHALVPAAVFSQPQIASIGKTEQECREGGVGVRIGLGEYGEIAYGWALEEHAGFCKVIADRSSGELLGAHIMGPQAATLIQPIVVAMTFGISPTDLVKRPYWIHPALGEVVVKALEQLEG